VTRQAGSAASCAAPLRVDRTHGQGDSSVGKTEARTHSFVVRVWIEAGAQPPWRGSVTHVSTGQRRHFTDLGEVVSFIEPYVDPFSAGGMEAIDDG
jgi:hypothetical protein